MNTASNMRVEVIAEWAAEHSDEHRFVFVYHIRILNFGGQDMQLLRRKWLITDANGKVIEVQGDGVVGEQPVILPGRDFQYSSFCELETPVGCMQGLYVMCDNQGNEFELNIPVFTLAVPYILH